MKFFKRLIHPKSKKSSKNPTTDAELGGQRVVDSDSAAIPVRSSSIQIEWVNIISSSHFNELFYLNLKLEFFRIYHFLLV